MNPRLLGLAVAHPPHRVAQPQVRAFAAALFAPGLPDTDRLLPVFEHASIDTRHFTLPIEEYATPATFAERNRTFVRAADELAGDAAAAALADAAVPAERVTHVILVTSSGLSTPTLETCFGPRIGLSTSAHRIPLWGLGCAGGVAALGLARALATDPGNVVLVVAVELCSLTFQREDLSQANLVATALFADGAAAAVVASSASGGITLGNHVEELLPDSRDVMGWDVTAHGLQVVFLRRIPALARSSYRGTVERALAPTGMAVEDLECLATHPGGRKVIEAQEQALGLPRTRFLAAREALRRFGNVSSVSVFQVLALLREQGLWGRPGIVSAFGPGFTSHVMVLG